MAKTPTKNYGMAPWQLTKGAISNFVAVTDFNRKNAIAMGRIYYFIEKLGSAYMYRGSGLIRPRLTKGWHYWPHMPWSIVPKDVQNKTHWRVFYDADEDYVKWKDDFDVIITKGINEKTLYICPSDPILTFYIE